MSARGKLTELFRKFPGIGPRQADRFVLFLLSQRKSFLDELIREIGNLEEETATCESCFQFFTRQGGMKVCSLCANPARDASKLLLISREVDLQNIERTGAYGGLYFVLGGTVPILEKNPEERIRIRELLHIIENRKEVAEIILATNATAEGEHTAEYIENQLKPLEEKRKVKISHLGRGLSTGTELEYSDKDTIVNALKNRV
jgi:recombination protein RecR